MVEQMTEEASDTQQIYIRQAAEQLNRRMATLRKWEQLDILPDELRSHRGHRGWRYWTPDQIEGIRDWLRSTDRRPGKGLPHYNPTESQLDAAIEAMRTGQKNRKTAMKEKKADFDPQPVESPDKARTERKRDRKEPPASFKDLINTQRETTKPRPKPGA